MAPPAKRATPARRATATRRAPAKRASQRPPTPGAVKKAGTAKRPDVVEKISEPAPVAAPIAAAPYNPMPRSARLLFVGGAAMAIGSLAPWVTIFLINISGVDAEYGIVTLLAGVVCSVAAYEVWKGGVFRHIAKRTVLTVALLAAIAGAASPIYVAAEAKRSVAGAQLGSGTGFGVPTAPGSTQFPSINNGLQGFTNSLAQAFGPKIGFGVWLSILGGLASMAGALDQLRKQQEPRPWA
jgi:hypothetical protein